MRMASEMKSDFGQLYRRAFAERDPLLKDLLLQQVQSQLDEWHQSNGPAQMQSEPLRPIASVSGLFLPRERWRA
jgi:hypothetical protein